MINRIKNSLKLNPLQNKTLVLRQALAADPDSSEKDEAEGSIKILKFPNPHGHHFHIGNHVISAKDANGLSNESVWKALQRKGLINCEYPVSISLTLAGQEYNSGISDTVLNPSDH